MGDKSIIRPPSQEDCPREAVPAAVNRRKKIVGSREIDGLDDIGRASATGDERRMTIESAIPEPPRLVVILILRK